LNEGLILVNLEGSFHGLAREQTRFMNWPDPSPARSLSLVVG